MLRRLAVILPLVAVLWLGLPGILKSRANASLAAAEYVCPPCGCGNDEKAYDKPGFCPACGMDLVLKGSAPADRSRATQQAPLRKAAILIFDGVQIIDYTGPYEVFGGAGIQVFTVATSTAPITTNMGMKVTPHYSLDEAPPADVLLIPGGGVSATQQDQRVLKWIQDRSKQAEYVVSVCNGAYILARTGLLDGLTATTTAGLIDGLAAAAPKVKVVRDQRYVDNGKFITTAGLSSGIDGALYVVSKLFGQAQAQLVALGIEYDWSGKSTYARANLADRYITRVLGRRLQLPVPEGAQAKLLSTEGTPQAWEVKWQVAGEASSANVLNLVNDRLVAAEWLEQKRDVSEGPVRIWKFEDSEGGQWRGQADAQSAGGKQLTVSLRIERTGVNAAKKSASSAAPAHQLLIRDAWIQEMPPSRKFTAAHMVIENLSGKETALVAATTSVAGAVELHRAEMNDGLMRMRKLDRINLPVGETELKGELHIMLIDLKAPLQAGDQVPLTLEFENGLKQTLSVPVRKRQAE